MKTPVNPKAQTVRHVGHTVTAFYDLTQLGWRKLGVCRAQSFADVPCASVRMKKACPVR